jgi:NADH-quinone oxidoreductase subunit H
LPEDCSLFDRKVTAWVQWRKGPPLLQPFYDFLKLLLVKETIVPRRGSIGTFLAAPVLALTGAGIAAVLILLPVLGIHAGFRGDLIVIFYLLTVPSLMYVMGALASANPLAAVGASREIKLMVGYELSFLLVLLAIVLRSGHTISLMDIIAHQQASGVYISANGPGYSSSWPSFSAFRQSWDLYRLTLLKPRQNWPKAPSSSIQVLPTRSLS